MVEKLRWQLERRVDGECWVCVCVCVGGGGGGGD